MISLILSISLPYIFHSQDSNGHISSVIPLGLKIQIDPENEPIVTPFDTKVMPHDLLFNMRNQAFDTVDT